MKIYLADFKNNEGNITEFEVEEKGKTYKVISKKDIIGWCYANRTIHKEDTRICMSIQDAFLKLESDAKENLEIKEEKYKSALASYGAIHDIACAIRLDTEKINNVLAELSND